MRKKTERAISNEWGIRWKKTHLCTMYGMYDVRAICINHILAECSDPVEQ